MPHKTTYRETEKKTLQLQLIGFNFWKYIFRDVLIYFVFAYVGFLVG
jgi:hypothetical protein